MFSINELTNFFAWCSIINLCLLAFAGLFIVLYRDSIINIHSKMLGLNPNDLPKLYFQYFANYKIGVFLFNIVPYIALKFMV